MTKYVYKIEVIRDGRFTDELLLGTWQPPEGWEPVSHAEAPNYISILMRKPVETNDQ